MYHFLDRKAFFSSMGSSRTTTCHSLLHSFSIIALWVTAFLFSHTTDVSGSADVSIATSSNLTSRLRIAPPLNLSSVLANGKLPLADLLKVMPAGSPRKRYQLIAHARISSPVFDITWHGGSLFTSLITVNLIFYGGGWSRNQRNIVTDFFTSFPLKTGDGGVPGLGQWWEILHAYRDGGGQGVSRTIRLGSVILDSSSVGSAIGGDSVVQQILANAICGGHIGGSAPSEMTHVLVSRHVSVAGFCTQFCGYHNMFYLSGRQVIYGLVGLPPASGCQGCQPAFLPTNLLGNGWTSPNGDAAVDTLISAIAHETTEIATNPDTRSGYYSDSNEYENADFCAYYYGNIFSTNPKDSSPTVFNVIGLNGRKYLIQTNYDLVKKNCVNYS